MKHDPSFVFSSVRKIVEMPAVPRLARRIKSISDVYDVLF